MNGVEPAADSCPLDSCQRLDKWLWCARFFKSRAAAALLCTGGRVRLSGRKIAKAHQPVRPGDVLTFPHRSDIRVVRVIALAPRRGPAAEARRLYRDLISATRDVKPACHAQGGDPRTGGAQGAATG